MIFGTRTRAPPQYLQSCEFTIALSDLRNVHGQVLVFGGFSRQVRHGAATLAAEQHVQTQLAGLAEENSELRRLYKHMETQLTFAAEELSGAQPGL